MSTPAPKRDDVAPPTSTTMVVMGAITGIAAAAAFAGWEWSLVRWLGLSIPAGADFDGVLGAYLLIGGGTGALLGAAGLRAGAWLGMVLAEAGMPSAAGLAIVPVGLVVGVIIARSPSSDERKLGLGCGLFIGLVLGLPLNLHLLPSPLAPIALVVDVGVLLLAAGVAAVTVLLGQKVAETGAVLPVVVANLLGWGAYALVDLPHAPVGVASQSQGPPVVVIVVDTLRADHLGAYGYDRNTSPNLDALARRSVVFDNAWGAAPWTLPAMGSLFTGRYPNGHGAGVNSGSGNSLSSLRRDVPVMAQAFQDAGYTTVGITTNPWTTAAFGFERGFQVYDDRVGPYAQPVAIHPLRVAGLNAFTMAEFRPAEHVTDAAVAQIESLGASGWMMVVHYMDVHGPHRTLDEDALAVEAPARRSYTDNYDAAIHRVDGQIGRLLTHVPRDAWVVVTADHGEELEEGRTPPMGAPQDVRHGHTLHEEILQVPLMVRVPGRSGRHVERMVGLVDIFPTLNDAFDLGVDTRFDGQPMPEVGASADGLDFQRILVAEAMRWGPEQQAARRGADKLIEHYGLGFEMYNIAEDPSESQQVGRAERGSSQRLRSLQSALPPVGRAATGEPAALGAEMRALLIRLGYADP
jgi:arylsulfatase A-like enzyme